MDFPIFRKGIRRCRVQLATVRFETLHLVAIPATSSNPAGCKLSFIG